MGKTFEDISTSPSIGLGHSSPGRRGSVQAEMAQSVPWVMGWIIWFSTAWTRILIEIRRDQSLRLSLEYITISTLPGGQKPSWLPPSGLREVSKMLKRYQ